MVVCVDTRLLPLVHVVRLDCNKHNTSNHAWHKVPTVMYGHSIGVWLRTWSTTFCTAIVMCI